MKFHERLGLFLEALDGDDFPQNVLTTHFGTGFQQGMFRVNVCDYGKFRILITIYNHNRKVFSKRVFDFIKADLMKLAPIESYWNGGHGSTGISIVLERRCPQSLLFAINNYHALENVFADHTEQFKIFDDWEKKRLKEVGWK